MSTQTPAPAETKIGWKRRLCRWLLIVGGTWLGVLLVLLMLERRLIFFPSSATDYWKEPPPALGARDVWFDLSKGGRVHAWWCEPPGWTPEQGATLYCHGNAGNLSHRIDSVTRWLAEVPGAVLIFDYPGYGKSTGKPDEKSCYAAGRAAYEWLTREKKVRPENIILLGKSLGGAIAVELATQKEYRALVLVATFTSIPDMAARQFPWLPARPFIRTRFDTLAKIGSVSGPVLIAHGTADRIIPYSMAEKLFAAAPHPRRLLPMHGYDHNHAPGPEFYAALKEVLAIPNPRGGTRLAP